MCEARLRMSGMYLDVEYSMNFVDFLSRVSFHQCGASALRKRGACVRVLSSNFWLVSLHWLGL
jgi:hypothetical protein